MYDRYSFSTVELSNKRALPQIEKFLLNNDLEADYDIQRYIAAWLDDRLVACGGIAGNILKCIAIDPAERGEGLSLKLLTELINLAYDMGKSELFLFTKPENKVLFSGAGFYPLAEVNDAVVLMENSPNRIQRYCQQLAQLRQPGKKMGSIVMNANPFTLGHRYLIEQAAAQCDWLHVFVVKEDASQFSYQDRLHLIRQGTQDMTNITVHEGSDYTISRATFPSYFIKDKGRVDHYHSLIDLQLFRRYLAPALGITHRFVGNEPLCRVTSAYNQQMKQVLQQPMSDLPAIEVIELQRLEIMGEPVSASRVRKLLIENDVEQIKALVPPTTFAFLQQQKIKP